MKRKFLFLLAIVFCQVINSFSQNIDKFICTEVGSKYSLVLNETDYGIHNLDLYFGYKFRNKLSLGIISGNTIILNFEQNQFETYIPAGFGGRYLIFEKQSEREKVSYEPFINLFYGVNNTDNYFLNYNFGINFVHTKNTNLYFGVGFSLIDYQNINKELYCLNASFGFRY